MEPRVDYSEDDQTIEEVRDIDLNDRLSDISLDDDEDLIKSQEIEDTCDEIEDIYDELE